VITETVTIEGPFGFYTVEKSVEVFSDDNCGNPQPLNGSFTYVYTLTNDPLSVLGIIGFSVPMPNQVALVDYGFIDGSGVEPSTVTASPGQVSWTFAAPLLNPGEVTEKLFIVSPYQPGDATVTINGDAGLDVTATNIAPVELPEPCPCSAFFWKLRSTNWWWISHKWFPGDDFDAVKARAVDLSGGFFADETALTDALKYWGWCSPELRAKRQLAAMLLNVAAGELFPGNTKCRLFQGTEIDFDGDAVADSTVGAEIANVITLIDSGDASQQNDAFHIALDINLGRTVIGAVRFH
jgi:hypothetical protein